MRCLAPAEIDRYISGVMDEVVAGGVTQHLAGCSRCREAVVRARAATAETILGPEEEGSQVTHLPVRCQKCGAQYAIPEERARGRRLTVRCMSCGGQMEVEGDDSGLSSPSLVDLKSGLTGERCWYLIEDRQRMGPYSEIDLLKRLDKGEITGETHVWRDGYKEWRKLSSLPQFKSVIDPALPVPVPRSSTDPFPPPPEATPGSPGYDPGLVANSMRRGTDPLPMISEVTPAPSTLEQVQGAQRTAIIDPVEEQPSESDVRTVLREPPDLAGDGDPHNTVLLDGEEASQNIEPTRLHRRDNGRGAASRAAFRVEERDREQEDGTELHEPGYAPEVEEAQRAALARATSDDGDPTRPRPLVERTAEIETPEAAAPLEISDEARTRLRYQPRDPREGLLDDEDEADDLAPIFDGGGLASTMEVPPEVEAPTPSLVVEPLPTSAPERDPAPAPAPAPEPAAPASDALEAGAWERRMQGQRSDNSVLFSLQHLKNLAGGKGGLAAFEREESGLVDIQALADEESAPAPVPVPLMLTPSGEESNSRVAMFFTVGMLGALLGAFGLLILLYLARPELFSALLSPGTDSAKATQPTPTAATPATPVPEPAPSPAVSPADAATQPPDQGIMDQAPAPVDPQASAPDPAPAEEPASTASAPAARPRPAASAPRGSPRSAASAPRPARDPAPAPAREVAPAPASRPAPGRVENAPSRTAAMDPFAESKPAAPKRAPAPRKKTTDQELDDLINAATTGDLPPPRKKKAAPRPRKRRPRPAAAKPRPSGLPERLTRSQVSAGMKRASGAVARCRTVHDRVGLVTISVTISGATGRIGKGSALGPLGSSPVGACVLKAVKRSATFPQFSGPAMTIKYPFILR